MTHKAFWDDPYLTSLCTTITSVAGSDITVAATIIYAFSGGQERDHGTIGGYAVLEARKDNNDIIYTLDDGHGLQSGDDVLITIDWERRYALMRLHFAAEIVLALIYKQFGVIEKIGAHIAQDKARIDFLWPTSLAPMLPAIQRAAQIVIDDDHEIVSAWSDIERERRYWEIAGFDRVACGGTHLRKTGEVGSITLKRKNVGKDKERIEIAL